MQVLAYTSGGDGVKSAPIHCQTEQDGNDCVIYKDQFIGIYLYCDCALIFSTGGSDRYQSSGHVRGSNSYFMASTQSA